MRRVIVCPTDFLFRLFQGISANSDSWLFLVSDVKTRTGLARQDANALAGALDDPGLYRRAHLSSSDLVMLMAPERARRGPSLVRILETMLAVAPDVPGARCATSCVPRWTVHSSACASSRCATSWRARTA